MLENALVEIFYLCTTMFLLTEHENSSNSWKIRKLRFCLGKHICHTWTQQNIVETCWTRLWTIRDVQPISNLKELAWLSAKNRWIFHNEVMSWWNPCQNKSTLWSKPIEIPDDLDFFLTLHMKIMVALAGFVNFFGYLFYSVMLFLWIFSKSHTFSKSSPPTFMINHWSN